MADHLERAKEAAAERRRRRDERRAYQRAVRLRRNRARMESGGFDVPPASQESDEKTVTPDDVGLEDKMLRPGELGLEDKGGGDDPVDPLGVVSFASEPAEERARSAGLVADDFADVEPSGKTGYTSADVRAVIEAVGG